MTTLPLHSIPVEALRRCEEERIHLIGSVKAHGALLVLSPDGARCQTVSANSAEFFGIAPEEARGRPLDDFLAAEHAGSILRRTAEALEGEPVAEVIPDSAGEHTALRIVAHHYRNRLFVEAEREERNRHGSGPETLYRRVRSIIHHTAAADDLEAFLQAFVREARQVLPFGRILVYRYDARGNGEVVAEAMDGEMESLLGMHYPSFDIPRNARRLLSLVRTTYIHDTHAEPVALVPREDPETGEAFDLTYCHLRSHSRNCVNYYRNLGLRSTMTVSLICRGELWGHLLLHNREARPVTYEQRCIGELLGEFLTAQIQVRMEKELNEARSEARRRTEQIYRDLMAASDWPAELFETDSVLLRILPAAGIAFLRGETGDVLIHGEAPSPDFVRTLVDRVLGQPPRSFYHTFCLAGEYPEFAEHTPEAAGVLAVRINSRVPDYLIWFRPEVSRDVLWAGEPSKDVEVTRQGEYVLHPRSAFDAWKTEVRGESDPWSSQELAVAETLQQGLTDIVLRYHELRRQVVENDLFRVRDAVVSCDQPILIEDESGAIRLCNEAFLRVFAIEGEPPNTRDDIRRYFVEPSDLTQLEDALAQGRTAFLPRITMKDAAGEAHICAAGVSRVRNAADQDLGCVFTFSDLTELESAVDARRRLERRVFEMQRLESMSVLASGVAQEFNNLLVGILGAAGLAKLDAAEDSQTRRNLQLIEDTAMRASELTRQILAFSGRSRFVLNRVDMAALVKRNVSFLRALAGSAIRLEAVVPDAPVSVRGDEENLRRVLVNLVTNSVEALEGQRGRIVIELSRAAVTERMLERATPRVSGGRKDFVLLRVIDNGPGIPAADLPRIFDPFFSTRFEGRGLGLPAVLGIVRSHDGFVHVARVEEETVITVGLPPAPGVEHAATPPPRKLEDNEVATALILVEEPAVCTVLERILESCGIHPVAFSDAAGALDALTSEDETWSFALLDLDLPVVEGGTILEAVRKRAHRLPVVAITESRPGSLHSKVKDDVLAVLMEKPFRSHDVRDAITQLQKRALNQSERRPWLK